MARRLMVLLAVLTMTIAVFCGFSSNVASAESTAASVPPISHLAVGDITASSVRLSWRWPSATSVTRVTIRMTKGAVAPASPTQGTLVGRVTRPGGSLTVRKLAALKKYAFAAFAMDRNGNYAKPEKVTAVTSPRPLKVGTSALESGIRGLYYVQVLTATGGAAPYTWSASGLPAGLSISAAGVVTGYPRSTGTRKVVVQVRDSRHVTQKRTLPLAVPTSLPAACVAKTCSLLSADTHTVHIPAAEITGVTRSAKTHRVTQVVLSGASVKPGDTLVLAPLLAIPSGLVAVATSLTAHGKVQTVQVTTATPAAAYYQGIVQTIGKRPRAAAAAARAMASPAVDIGLDCDRGATTRVHGLSVTPNLTPSVGLEWKHDLFGGKGVYVGFGGLKLFQVALTGTITVNLGVSISGAADCTMDLPGVATGEPAGELGWILLQIDPTLELSTTGRADVQTSVTLNCYAGFRWYKGTSTPTDYCSATHDPLSLTSDSGVDVTVTGKIDASVSLDDLPGVEGTIQAALHAGYHPGQSPVAEIDASSDWELKANLATIWKGGPSLTIAHGQIFSEVLARWGSKPPAAAAAPAITVRPAYSLPWSAAACGDFPPPAQADFTVQGSGFRQGERVGISTGWAAYPGNSSADSAGNFSVTNAVGEVPNVPVSGQDLAVTAVGSEGSSATSATGLFPDTCLDAEISGGGVGVWWGANGFTPSSPLQLTIDGAFQSAAVTDDLGSGGSVAEFSCPASGTYTYEIAGTDNGQPVSSKGTNTCTHVSAKTTTVGEVSLAAGSRA